MIVWFILLFYGFIDGQIIEPTRVVDLWNPFGTTTTRMPGSEARKDEIIVRLPIGDIIGRQFNLTDLPWDSNHDPSEVTNPEWGERDPNPVPPKNNVTVFYFLGVPYAMPPISERRFKVCFLLMIFLKFVIFSHLNN